MWQALTEDVSSVCKEIMEKQLPEKQTYMSLPRPGVSNFPMEILTYGYKQLFNMKQFLCEYIFTETRYNK